MWRRPLQVRDLVPALAPTISILLALAAIRSIWPQMFAPWSQFRRRSKSIPNRLQRIVVFVRHIPDLSHRPLVDLAIAPRDHATRALDLVRPRRAHSHFHLDNL